MIIIGHKYLRNKKQELSLPTLHDCYFVERATKIDIEFMSLIHLRKSNRKKLIFEKNRIQRCSRLPQSSTRSYIDICNKFDLIGLVFIANEALVRLYIYLYININISAIIILKIRFIQTFDSQVKFNIRHGTGNSESSSSICFHTFIPGTPRGSHWLPRENLTLKR